MRGGNNPQELKWTGSTVISASQGEAQSLLCPAVVTYAVKHAFNLSGAVYVGPAAVICPSQMRLMKPQEKVFFKDPVKLLQSWLEHTSQIALFQRTQMERVTAHFKHKSVELERHLKEVTEQGYRQLSELKRENTDLKKQLSNLKRETADLKKPLSQRRVSPGQFHIDGTQRVSLPVAVTSPVTPRSRTMSYIGSAESQAWARDRAPHLSSITTPGSAISISSHSSLHEHVHRTPTSFNTPTRSQRQTPNVFQFQFMSGLSTQSPRR
ncbi:RING finger protein 212B isoform X4 [Etheostoma spectabile]|uniref:RING finger protein 212B isoform X4 n=1 Tax=Etheostoma spectabile TaxID=54343 RepID=UPI0013AEDD99|nr:RING finger protein 212B isoform X4 [Etheostoma spectabile]